MQIRNQRNVYAEMLFNSLEFAVFLPIVYLAYWMLNNDLRKQNILLLFSSYLFYGWWDWRFLSLIIFSSLVDYRIGLAMRNSSQDSLRKALLLTSVSVNLGMLGFFKYYNFFIENFVGAFNFMGSNFSAQRLSIILPVGISFYTFQALSYSIDVYRRRLEPTNDSISFFAFVAFFPQLVAGPIERANNLLPQFYKSRVRNYRDSAEGLKRILWGLFQKVVIADNCAEYVNLIFENYAEQSSGMLVFGAILFSFQIYGDFSGYSEIAIGTAKLFGFNLIDNFRFPYFSRDVAEFWRRWHISLSTWFRDYLYIPLGGSHGNTSNQVKNTIIIFLVSGFWHGANWTFIFWGALHAAYIIPLVVLKRNRNNLEIADSDSLIPSFKTTVRIFLTFSLTCFAWIFFRAENLTSAFGYVQNMLLLKEGTSDLIISSFIFMMVLVLMVFEWMQRTERFVLDFSRKNVHPAVSWMVYLAIAMLIACFFGKKNDFIYFQF